MTESQENPTPEQQQEDPPPAPFPLPEVRQCQDTANFLYGAVAVKGFADNEWGVMHPKNGGHWATDAEVETWTVLDAAEGS